MVAAGNRDASKPSRCDRCDVDGGGPEAKVASKILIIGGDPSVTAGMVLTLMEKGYQAWTVPDYFEGLAVLNDFRPDLVILDETRSLVDAWQACAQLYRLLGAPVIVMGGSDSDEAWTRAVAAGADFYLTRPFGYLELGARVKAILRRY